MKEILMQYAAEFAATVALAILSMLMARAAAWLKAKTKDEQAAASLERIHHTAQTVVAHIEQTMRKEFARSMADGRLTKGEAVRLQEIAVKRINEILTPEVKATAGASVANLEAFLRAKVEQAVLQMRQRAAAG